MAENHIDYREVSEYGRYFLDAVATLESSIDPSPESAAPQAVSEPATAVSGALVDISMIRDIVEQAVLAVEASLPKTDGLGGATPKRASVQDAMRDCRDRIQRFYYYLRSLHPDAGGDLLAFFPSGRLGALNRLGAAGLCGKVNAITRGFSAPGNLGLANALVWRQELEAGRDALERAIASRSWRSREAVGSGSLVRARAYFLRVYHGMAKPAVRALLTHLGRDHEYRRFFLDLQMGERLTSQAA